MWFMRDFVVRALLWALHTFILIDECGLPELVPVEFGGTMGAGA